MRRVIVVVLMLICTSGGMIGHSSLAQAATYGKADVEGLRELELLNIFNRSTLVVTGTVKQLNYVQRNGITTDVVVKVDETIKGTPNTDSKHVTFMIDGGQFVGSNGKTVTKKVGTAAKFEVGEKVMLFLTNASPLAYYANYPHGGYHLIHPYFKRQIKDNTVKIAYLRTNTNVRYIDVPVNLTVLLTKAFLANREQARTLENQIKSLVYGSTETEPVRLPESLVSNLVAQSKTIINAEDE